MEKINVNPFTAVQTYQGKKDFDKYYFELEAKKFFVESGEVDPETGDKLGIEKSKFIVHKRDIKQTINAEASTVGVYPMLERLARLGEDLPVPELTENVIDTTNMPEDLVQAGKFADAIKKQYDKVPDELKKGQDIETFLGGITEDKIKAYVESVISKKFPGQTGQEKEKEKVVIQENKGGDK